MFRSQSRSVDGRFSLLLVDEGEYYFDEHAALRQLGEDVQQAGRLRVLSHSVIFEPDEEAAPLVKLKFASVQELVEHKEHSEWDGTGADVADVAEPVPEEEQQPEPEPAAEPPPIDEAEFDEDAPELDAPPVEGGGDEEDEDEDEDDYAGDQAKPKGKERKRRSSLEGGVGSMGKGLGKGLGKGIGGVGKGMGSMGKGMGKGLKGGVGKGLGAVTSGIDGVKSVGDLAKDGLKEGVGAATGGLSSVTDAALSAKTGLDQGLSGATSGLDSVIGKESVIGGGVGKGFGAGLKAAKAARDAAMNAADVAASAAGAAADKTGVSAVAEKTGISGALAAGADAALSAKDVAAQKTGLDAGLTGAASGLTGRLTSGVTGLTDLASGLATGASDLATGGLTNITGVVGGVASLASGAMDATVGRLSGAQDDRPTVAITFTCDNAVLMKPYGKEQPYDVDRTVTRYTFTLVAPSAAPEVEGEDTAAAEEDGEEEAEKVDGGDARMAEIAPQIRRLYDIITAPASEGGAPRAASWQRPEALEALIAEREAEIEFDTSELIDPEEETTLFESKAERISPLVSNPGRLLLTNRYLYFQPFNNAEGVADAVLSWSLQAEGSGGGGGGGLTRLERRRHQLRKTGAELVFKQPKGKKGKAKGKGGKKGQAESVFLAFGTNQEREDFVRMVCENTLLSDDKDDHEQKMRMAAEEWGSGRMSNYDYLMHLNSAAGRSINDIIQYPVMPWVVKDYESDFLDLDDPETFRDLSKPVGALEPKRLQSVKQRYDEMLSLNDPMMIPFMWGSHYSTAGYVLYYLAREAPDLMLKLQSGAFDKPDRLFSSIPRAWKGVLENPMDVKELIPEFYCYDDEEEQAGAGEGEGEGGGGGGGFLRNHREIDWGVKQDGTAVGDVELPPWANDSAGEFVKQMSEALECDYVSQHLHEWIDLIFGYKQQGEEAVAAGNLFGHLSYEGSVDIRTIEDPQERAAILTQINEFGQTPSQLFLSAHPKRSEAATEAGLKVVPIDPFEQDLDQLTLDQSAAPSGGGGGKRGSSSGSAGGGAASRSRSPAAHRANVSRQPHPKKFLPVVTDRESAAGLSSSSSLGSGWLTCGLEGMRCKQQFQLAGTTAAGGGLSLLALSAADAGGGGGSAGRLYGTGFDGTLRTFDLKGSSSSSGSDGGGGDGGGNLAGQSRSTKLGSLALSAVRLTENDSVAIVGSWDNSIYVYSMVYGRIMERQEAHAAGVSALDLQGDSLISASWDGGVKVWKLRRGSGGGGTLRLELSMELHGGHDSEVTCVAMATKRAETSGEAYDGSKWACSGGSDGSFCLWCIDPARTGTGVLVKKFPDAKDPIVRHQGAVTAVAWTDDGCFVASTGEDDVVRLYCVRGSGVSALAEVVHVLDRETFSRMHSLTWIGDHLVAGGEEGGLEIWRLARHEKAQKVALIALADEVDGDDSASMWASAGEYHSGTTVRHVLPLGRAANAEEEEGVAKKGGSRQLQQLGLATIGDDGSVAVWTDRGR